MLKQDRLMNELAAIQLLLLSPSRHNYNDQRYTLSEDKLRYMEFSSIYSKSQQLQKRRLSNQDADSPETRQSMKNDDMEKLVEKMRAHPGFTIQRATFPARPNTAA